MLRGQGRGAPSLMPQDLHRADPGVCRAGLGFPLGHSLTSRPISAARGLVLRVARAGLRQHPAPWALLTLLCGLG